MSAKSPKLKDPVQAFRYPGGKGKICWDIVKSFPPRVTHAICSDVSFYCEPFVGSGAMLARVLLVLPPSAGVILGDRDVGIASFWRCLCDPAKTERLSRAVLNFTPTLDAFFRFKELDGTHDGDDVVTGFRKLALHQMSFSGVGAKAGGPIGGKGQRGVYDVTCRFRPERHVANIASLRHRLAKLRGGVQVVHGDFAEALGRIPVRGGFAYLDPPYYLKGEQLYVHSMNPADHDRLAGLLRHAAFDWVLSYDDHPEVHALYRDWAEIRAFKMTATIETKKGAGARRKNHELVIANRI